MGLPLEKVPQLFLHFACSTPLRPELKPTERESLKIMLQEHNPEMFQLFNISSGVSGPEPVLFQVARQYTLGSAMATAPSFVLTPSSISLMSVVKLGETFFSSSRTLEASELNNKMRETIFKAQEILKGMKFTRAGKVFELTLGPLSPSEKEKLTKHLLANSEKDIGELRLLYTRFIPLNNRLLNIRTELQFQQMKLEDPVQVAIKVDINNRNLSTSLDPRDVDALWKEADSLIGPHMEQLVDSMA